MRNAQTDQTYGEINILHIYSENFLFINWTTQRAIVHQFDIMILIIIIQHAPQSTVTVNVFLKISHYTNTIQLNKHLVAVPMRHVLYTFRLFFFQFYLNLNFYFYFLLLFL